MLMHPKTIIKHGLKEASNNLFCVGYGGGMGGKNTKITCVWTGWICRACRDAS